MPEIVIVGLGNSGYSALQTIHKYDKNCNIVVIEKRDHELYSPCAIPWALQHSIDTKTLIHSIPKTKNIVVKLNETTKKIDVENKIIITDKNKYVYDKLILATGSQPIVPKELQCFYNKCLFVCHTLNDLKNIQTYYKTVKNAIVVGAGAIGLEIALALKHLGLKVKVIDKMPTILSANFDTEISEIIQNYLSNTLEICTNTTLTTNEILQNNAIVICAIGVTTNIQLALNSGIKTSKGILVNEYMETSVSDIYACGDCAEVFTNIGSIRTVSRLAPSAYIQGKVAGMNALGMKRKYTGTNNLFVAKLMDLEIASVGLTENYAKNHYKVKSAKITIKNKPQYMKNLSDVTLKLIVDEKYKILGAQCLGDYSGWRCNLIDLCIRNNFTLHKLLEIEFSYNPEINNIYEILYICSEILLRQ